MKARRNARIRSIYLNHKGGAIRRGIDWEFNYPLWIRKWKESGHWKERGRCGHEYVMARYGDIGPYSYENTKIITQGENIAEGNRRNLRWVGKKHTKETLRKLSESHKGNRHNDETLAKMCRSQRARREREAHCDLV